MIPDISETIREIEAAGYGWLVRTIHDEPRDTWRGTGSHFAHVYLMKDGRHVKSSRASSTSAGAALYEALCQLKV